MKKLVVLLTYLFIVFSSESQIINPVVGQMNTDCFCSDEISFYCTSGPNGDFVTLYLDWGDGTSSEHQFSTPSSSIFVQYFNHDYTSPGQYNGTYSIYSAVLNDFVITNGQFELISYPSMSCGSAFVNVVNQNTGQLMLGVPIQMTDFSGLTTTLYPILHFGSWIYVGFNQNNAPFSVSVDENWLVQNGYQQSSSDVIINSISDCGEALNSSGMNQFSLNIMCSQVSFEPDFTIHWGAANDFVAPLETGLLQLELCNIACMNSSDGIIQIQFPNDFIPYSDNLTNAVFESNILQFDLIDFFGCQSFLIPISFPGTTPAGTSICFPVQISAVGDTDLSNNTDTICGIVLNSYDPNDKQVNHPATINPDTQEEFVYQIRFQNDGNFPAVNVVVRDTISSNLDISTFRLLETSHPGAASVNPTTREVTFTFNAIWLESSDVDLEASQGYIVYEIKEAEGLVEGDAIENTAHIFFDFNPAIVTNTTVNTNAYPVGVIENDKPQLSMYPNPTSSVVTFSGAAVQKVVIYDVLGQVVLTRNITNNTLSLSGLTNGVYFVEMHTEAGLQTQRLVVNK